MKISVILYKYWFKAVAPLLALAFLSPAGAQEVLTPLYSNPAAKVSEPIQGRAGIKTTTEAILELPFFEDFTGTSHLPDAGRWADNYAFVNNNFCIDPVTNGVATLDALDSDGSIYSHAKISPLTFVADTLCSMTINLEYPASDSIYLSFFYQPGGWCDPPEEEDSLLIDFYVPDPVKPDSGTWINIWSMEGSVNADFRQIMIPVTEDRFLSPSFRFRFRNKASLSKSNDFLDKRGNADYWHLDYIRLDRNRTASDTILKDVAFVTPLGPLFKDLRAIPWSHFEKAYNTTLAQTLPATYRNHDDEAHNITRNLVVEEALYGESYPLGTTTAQDIPAFSNTTVEFDYSFPLDFTRGDSSLLRFKAALRTDEGDPKQNDTLVLEQWFKDYYAFDDGTAEAGFGLLGDGTEGGQVAMKYYSYEADDLTGIYIYFNQLYDSVNLDFGFSLRVWDDNNGMPGELIWQENDMSYPQYSSEYPGFLHYAFSEEVAVDGTFFVGWRQEDKYKLNVGFDLNSIPGFNVLYFSTGAWQASDSQGSMMLRPIMKSKNIVSIAPEESRDQLSLKAWPNPAGDFMQFSMEGEQDDAQLQIQIFDPLGRMIYKDSRYGGTRVDLSSFAPGFYIVQGTKGKKFSQVKILVQ